MLLLHLKKKKKNGLCIRKDAQVKMFQAAGKPKYNCPATGSHLRPFYCVHRQHNGDVWGCKCRAWRIVGNPRHSLKQQIRSNLLVTVWFCCCATVGVNGCHILPGSCWDQSVDTWMDGRWIVTYRALSVPRERKKIFCVHLRNCFIRV